MTVKGSPHHDRARVAAKTPQGQFIRRCIDDSAWRELSTPDRTHASDTGEANPNGGVEFGRPTLRERFKSTALAHEHCSRLLRANTPWA